MNSQEQCVVLEDFRNDLKKSMTRTLVLELSHHHLMQIGEGSLERGLAETVASARAVYDHEILEGRGTADPRNTNILLLRPGIDDPNAFVLYDALFSILDKEVSHEYNKDLTQSIVKAAISIGVKGFMGGAVVDALDGMTGSYFGALQEKALGYASEMGGQTLEWLTDNIFGTVTGIALVDHIEGWTEGVGEKGIGFTANVLAGASAFYLEKETVRTVKEIYEAFNPETINYAKLFDFLVQTTMALSQNSHKAIVIENPHLLDQASFSILTKLLSIARDLMAEQHRFLKITMIQLYTDPSFQPQGAPWKERVADPAIEANLVTWDAMRRLRNFLMRYGLLETPTTTIPRVAVHSDLFVGRRAELERLNNHGEQIINSTDPAGLIRADVILGDPGVGKTALYYRYLKDTFFSATDNQSEIARNTVIRLKILNEPGIASANSGLSTLETAIVAEMQRLEDYAKVVRQKREKIKNILTWVANTSAGWGLRYLDIEDLVNVSKNIRNRLMESRRRAVRDEKARGFERGDDQGERAAYYEAILDSIRFLQIMALRIRGHIKAGDSLKFLLSDKLPDNKKRTAFKNILDKAESRVALLLFIDDVQWIDDETAAFVLRYLLPMQPNLHMILTSRTGEDLSERYNAAFRTIEPGKPVPHQLILFEAFQLFSANPTKLGLYRLTNQEKSERGLDNAYFNGSREFTTFNQSLYGRSQANALVDVALLNQLSVHHVAVDGLDIPTVVELVQSAIQAPTGDLENSAHHHDLANALGNEIFAFLADQDHAAIPPTSINTLMAVETLNILADPALFAEGEMAGLVPIIVFGTDDRPHFVRGIDPTETARGLFQRLRDKYRASFRDSQGSFNLASHAVLEERLHLIQSDLGLGAYYGILISAFVGIPFQRAILNRVLTALEASQDPLLTPIQQIFRELSGLCERDYETLENIYTFMRRLSHDQRRYKHALLEDFLAIKVDAEIACGIPDPAQAEAARQAFHELVYEVLEGIYIERFLELFDEDSEIDVQYRDNYKYPREELIEQLEAGEISEEEFEDSEFGGEEKDEEQCTKLDRSSFGYNSYYIPRPLIVSDLPDGTQSQWCRPIDDGALKDLEERTAIENLMHGHLLGALDRPSSIRRLIALTKIMTDYMTAKPSQAIPLMDSVIALLRERIAHSETCPEWVYDPHRLDNFADLLQRNVLLQRDGDYDNELAGLQQLIEERYQQYPDEFSALWIQCRVWSANADEDMDLDETIACLHKIVIDAQALDVSIERNAMIRIDAQKALLDYLGEGYEDLETEMLERHVIPELLAAARRFSIRSEDYLHQAVSHARALGIVAPKRVAPLLVLIERETEQIFSEGLIQPLDCYQILGNLAAVDEIDPSEQERLRCKIRSYYTNRMTELERLLSAPDSPDPKPTLKNWEAYRHLNPDFAYDNTFSALERFQHHQTAIQIAERLYAHDPDVFLETVLAALDDGANFFLDADDIELPPSAIYNEDGAWDAVALRRRAVALTTEAFARNPSQWRKVHDLALLELARELNEKGDPEAGSRFLEARSICLNYALSVNSPDQIDDFLKSNGETIEYLLEQQQFDEAERLLQENLHLSLEHLGYDKWDIREELAAMYAKTERNGDYVKIQEERYIEAQLRFKEDPAKEASNYAFTLETMADEFKKRDPEKALALLQEERQIWLEQFEEAPFDSIDDLDDCLERLMKHCKRMGLKSLAKEYKQEKRQHAKDLAALE